ncbi:MAG: condensation domain-containing protein [Fischerella sp. CENA71]|nr:condensation domain-containing protein [Fischerella sp. CENA71]
MNRLLTPSEHLMWLLACDRPINVVLSATIRGAISVNQITEALGWIQHRHPILGTRIIINQQQQPQLVSEGVPTIPLRVIERQDEEHWCQEISAQLLSPFCWSEEPLARVVLLHSPDVSELLVTYHHIADGLSGAYLMRDIWCEITKSGSYREPLPEIPPIDQLLPPVIGDGQKNAVDFDWGVEVDSTIQLDEAFHERFHVLHWYFSPEETNKLVARCRLEQTTVHGALCACFLLSLAVETSSSKETHLKCLSPFNLRNYLTIAVGENFGEYIARVVTSHSLNQQTQFWDLARQVKHQINQAVVDKTIYEGGSKAKSFLNTKPDKIKVRQYAKNITSSDIAITNLGRLEIPVHQGGLELEKLYFTVTGFRHQPIIVAIATTAGKMCVTFRYQESLIPSVSAQRINLKAVDKLRQAVE